MAEDLAAQGPARFARVRKEAPPSPAPSVPGQESALSPLKPRRIVPIAALVLVALVSALGAPAPASADGIFLAQCTFSHRASDDPILFHGMPGKSHSHD